MTAGRTAPAAPESPPCDGPVGVVVDPGLPPYAVPVLTLHGPLDGALLEAELDRIAAEYPGAPVWRSRLRRRGPARHTLRLTSDAPGTPEPPVGLLADRLTRRPPDGAAARSFPAGPVQRELLADADAHPGRGHHVEQLSWTWSGPFDLDRFTAAWQSVFDREAVLRAAFDEGSPPRTVVRDRVAPEVRWIPPGAGPWQRWAERDRLRGVDPRVPGPLRLTVLGGDTPPAPGAPTVRVLLTYHHALLDDWSTHLLLASFYRAYLADGRLPGGVRRPDAEDYARWLAGRDTAAARDYWTRALPSAPVLPVLSGAAPGQPADAGRTRLRLTRAQTDRLDAWAALRGSTVSGVLQAVWALLLYRARGGRGAAAVRFNVAVSGRGIPFEGVERLPGALCSPLPLSVEVDPRATVPALLAQLRDRAVDMAAYGWVSAGQVRAWTGTVDDPADSLLVFEDRPRWPDDLEPECAAQGIRMGRPMPWGAGTAFPVTVVAHRDDDGRLVLTATRDRTGPADVGELLARGVTLLSILPQYGDRFTTVGEALDLLSADLVPNAVEPVDPVEPVGPADAAAPGPAPAARAEPALVTLRPARRPGAGTVCLVQSPDVPRSRYDLLAGVLPGAAAVVLLRPLPGGPGARYPALRRLLDPGAPLVLGALTGGGVAACELTRLFAADGGRPPPVVVTTGGAAGAALLARTLRAAAAHARRPADPGPTDQHDLPGTSPADGTTPRRPQ
ncbi:condensation domain-containing protein [Streptacidiphilus carbonis]|uniref:condensation domain-containing protein n=1 Tax=Streptacidiphilus carbonis TaxID=105422 RepID=UPI0006950E14|nr:condensation domain-containing protein [Streptacidiphilus carbonis]